MFRLYYTPEYMVQQAATAMSEGEPTNRQG